MKKILAYIIVLIVIVGVYLSIWAGGKAEDICGPTQITRYNDEEIWVLHHNELNILDENGRLKRAINQLDLGVSATFADLAVTRDLEVIIGDRSSREIRWYSNEGLLLRVIKLDDEKRGTYQGTFKFAFDEESRCLFVTDSSNHIVKVFDKSGKFLNSFGQKGDGPSDLHFPNRIVIGPDELLYIADTNNHRISILDKDWKPIGKVKTIVREIPKRNHALSNIEKMALGGNIWPTFFDILAVDEIVVINKGDGLRYGNVAIVGKNGNIRNLLLPPDCDPINVLVRSDDILISDNENMRVLRFAFDGKPLDDFGDSRFKEKLERSKKMRDGFREIRNWSQMGLFLILPCLLIALFLERSKAKAKTSSVEKNLTEKLDLIPIPASNTYFTSTQKVIYGLSFLLVIIYPLLLTKLIKRMPGLCNHIFSLSLLSLILIGTAVYLCFKLNKAGAFRKRQLLNIEKKLRMQAISILSILKPDERIGLFTLSMGTRKTNIPHLVILTTHRVLIFKTDLIGRKIKRIRELAYQSIDKVDTMPWTKSEARFAKLSGAGFISIHIHGIEEILQFRLIWAELADIISNEMATRKSLSGGLFTGMRDICIKCFSSIPADDRCLKCGQKKISPAQAALWSLLYPGLGQLKNGSLLKGSVHMAIGTSFLFTFIMFSYTLYRGNAEIYPYDMSRIAIYTVLFWLISVRDAYYSVKQ